MDKYFYQTIFGALLFLGMMFWDTGNFFYNVAISIAMIPVFVYMCVCAVMYFKTA